MADDVPALRAPTPERREQVIAALSDHFAAGRLELEQLESRIDLALRVATLAELDALTADLAPSGSPVPAAAPEARRGAPAERLPVSARRTLAVLSGSARRGAWLVAPRHRAIALMGSATLDFREARLSADVTEVRLTALMGGFSVIVPPDLDVEVDGTVILGGIEDRSSEGRPPAGARKLRIRAYALMGGVEVKVRE